MASEVPEATSGPVRRVTEHDAALLATFLRRTWDPHATPESVRAGLLISRDENLTEPGEPVPAYAFHLDGEIIGYLGTLTATFWDGASELQGHWMKGFWVLEEYRNGPIGFQLLRYATDDLGLCGVMTVAPPSVRLFGAMGFRDLGAVPNQVSILRPTRFLRTLRPSDLERTGAGRGARRAFGALQALGLTRLTGWGLEVVLTLSDSLRPRRRLRRVHRVNLPDLAPESMENLWLSMRRGVGASLVRNSAYLLARFDTTEEGPYLALAARDGERLAGIAVIGKPKVGSESLFRDVRVAVLADLIVPADDGSSIESLLRGARKEARQLGADLLVASSPHASVLRHLRPPHFLTRAGNVHLMIRDTDPGGSFSTSLEEWWSMRGDAGSDEGL